MLNASLGPGRRVLFLCFLVSLSLYPIHAESLVLRVGVYPNPPKIIIDPEGAIGGFHPELLELITEENDWSVVYVPGTFVEGLDRLENGEIDMLMDVAYSPERDAIFDFNRVSVLTDWGVIYARKDLNPVEWSDLSGLRVTGMEGGIHLDGPSGFHALAGQFHLYSQTFPVFSYEQAFRALEAGVVDIAVVNRLFGILHEDEYDINATSFFFNPISVRYALSDTLPSAVAWGLDRVLKTLQNDPDSGYYRLIDEYLVGDSRNRIPRWVFFVLSGGGLFILVLLVFGSVLLQEVARRRESERALAVAKDQAEEANRAKSVFLANMTHEIRTPMNAILGYSEILQKNPNTDPGSRKFLKVIHRSGEHLLDLINNVLDMSRISSGKIVHEPRDFDLKTLMEDLSSFFEPMLKGKGLGFSAVHVSVDGNHLIGDERKIKQILINLVGNAVKFTEKGRVSLNAEVIRGDRGQHQLIFRVRDTGPGIPPGDQQRVFEAFDQGSVEEKKSGGTGLGLVISRNLASVMDGHLSLEESSPEGSTFTLTMPVRVASDHRIGPRDGLQATRVLPHHLPMTVLIADDDATNRSILVDILDPLGFHVELAVDGEDCVRAVQEHEPQVVLLDIRMPKMDGIQATKAIRRLPNGKKVKIVALSASTLESEKGRILDAGADGFLFKPYRINDLLRAIGQQAGIDYEWSVLTQEEEYNQSESAPPDFAEIRLNVEMKEELLRACRRGSKKEALAILERAKMKGSAQAYLADRLDRYDFETVENLVERMDT